MQRRVKVSRWYRWWRNEEVVERVNRQGTLLSKRVGLQKDPDLPWIAMSVDMDLQCDPAVIDGVVEQTLTLSSTARPGSEDELRCCWSDQAHVVPIHGTDFENQYDGFLRINLASSADVRHEAMHRILAVHPQLHR